MSRHLVHESLAQKGLTELSVRISFPHLSHPNPVPLQSTTTSQPHNRNPNPTDPGSIALTLPVIPDSLPSQSPPHPNLLHHPSFNHIPFTGSINGALWLSSTSSSSRNLCHKLRTREGGVTAPHERTMTDRDTGCMTRQ